MDVTVTGRVGPFTICHTINTAGRRQWLVGLPDGSYVAPYGGNHCSCAWAEAERQQALAESPIPWAQ